MQASVWLFSDFGKGRLGSHSGHFKSLTKCSMKLYPNTIDRNRSDYRDRHYRAHWQPMWAVIGLSLCIALLLSLGWGAVYDICADTQGVTREDSIVDLASAYLGVSDSPTALNFLRFADTLKSQPYSSACTLYTSSYTTHKSGRTPLLETSGSQPMYPTKVVLAIHEDSTGSWERL